MDYGITRRFTRAKVPMQVLIGFYPTEPVKLSSLAAPLDIVTTLNAPIAGRVAIKSGMAIVKDDGNHYGLSAVAGFRNSVAATDKVHSAVTGAPVSIYIALHDGDALDVQASGKLVGLDCSDKFEVQTGYYKTGHTWAIDDPVTAGDDGLFAFAVPGDTVVGYITAIGSGAYNSLVSGGLTPCATDMTVIQFKTALSGAVVQA